MQVPLQTLLTSKLLTLANETFISYYDLRQLYNILFISRRIKYAHISAFYQRLYYFIPGKGKLFEFMNKEKAH